MAPSALASTTTEPWISPRLRGCRVAGHQAQDVVAAADGPVHVARRRGVVARRLRDPGQERRLVRVGRGIARERLAEVVLGCGGEAVAPVAHVDEAGVAG